MDSMIRDKTIALETEISKNKRLGVSSFVFLILLIILYVLIKYKIV